MHSLLDSPQPKLARLEFGLSSADRQALWRKWRNEGYDGIEVNIFGGSDGPRWPMGQTHTLDFLADFPGLKAASVIVSDLASLEPLSHAASSLESLAFGGWTEPSKLSCKPLAQCRKLRALSLNRMPKDLGAIETLTGLEELSLLGYTFKSLDVLRPLKNLERLWIGFGSVPDLGPVCELSKLKALELMRLRKLGELSPLSQVKALQFLAVADMKQVTEMPDCSNLKSLRRVYLDTMNGITDLSGLAKAPGLEELIVVESRIEAGVFDPIIAYSKLKRVTVGLTSRKVEAEVNARFGKRAISVFGTKDEKFVLK
ncbi:MAG: hypothetical protein J5I93_16960 [Pirellulaceae bacterium]|nr:hypothetical protein [Pirellulaceae bacterium]